MLKIVLLSALVTQNVYGSAASMRYRYGTGHIHEHKISIELERISFKNKDGVRFWLRSGKPVEALRDMLELAASHGLEIKINSAYRTYKEQKSLWEKTPNLALPPGEGGERTHQTGCAIDIRGTTKKINGTKHKTLLYWWLKRFGPRFHFYETVPGEPWHWTYLGPLDDKGKSLNKS